MKKRALLFLLTILFFQYHLAQDNNQDANTFNPTNELNQLSSTPNSPEATAFTQYGDNSVSFFTGSPDISVPIYTHTGKELNLPIGLSYDATGVRVEELATQVGLSFNLNVGGRISRIANGFPDDFIMGDYQSWFLNEAQVRTPMLEYIDGYLQGSNGQFSSEQDLLDYFEYLQKVKINNYETQPDYFSFNALGMSDYFVIDVATLEAKSLTNPRRKVSFITSGSSISEWKLINDDGTTFYFTLPEETRVVGTDVVTGAALFGLIKVYNSSWLLTKIESANQKDVYEFNYQIGTDYWDQDQPASIFQSISNIPANDNPGTYSVGFGSESRVDSQYRIKQHFIQNIKHNNEIIVSFELGERLDLGVDNKIDRINIHNRFNNSEVYRKYNFEYSYFGTTLTDPVSIQAALNNNTITDKDIRLKLDEIEITAPSATNPFEDILYNRYRFSYNSPASLPSRISLAQDYLGYYNGKNNSVLYPAVTVGDNTYQGADRSPSFLHTKIGVLNKIEYPTGGFSEFVYEQHATPLTSGDTGSQVQEVIYGIVIIDGGLNPSGAPFVCGEQDIFPGEPMIGSTVFEITDAGTYQFEYVDGNVGEVNGFPTQAYIVDLSTSNSLELPYHEIASHDCSILAPTEWFGFSSTSGFLNLSEGFYQILIANPNDGQTSSLRVFREEDVDNPNTGTVPFPRAGRRISTIRDFTDTGVLAKEKRYQYTIGINSAIPSGEVLFNPTFDYSTQQEIITPGGCEQNATVQVLIQTTLNRTTSSSGGDRPHVGYSKVFEIVNDYTTNSESNGYSEYTFYNSSTGGATMGVHSSGVAPNINNYIMDYEIGKGHKVKHYKANDGISNTGNELVTANETSYRNDLFYINRGLYVSNNGLNANKYPLMYFNTTGNYYSYYLTMGQIIIGGTEVCFAFQNLNPPLACDDPNITCAFNRDFSTNEMRVTSAGGRIGNTLKVIKHDYFQNQAVTTVTRNEYDENLGYLLKTSELTDSQGKSIKTVYTYPQELTNLSNGGDLGSIDLVNDNQITMPLETRLFENELLLSTRKTNFQTFGNGIFPKAIYYIKGAEALEERITIDRYDSRGNVIQMHNTDSEVNPGSGPPTEPDIIATAILWGYDFEYPIIKAQNATYNELVAQLANLSIPRTVADLQTLSNTELFEAINELRALLPKALLTTYTYRPQVGIASMTDSRGYTTFYTYDEFHRLKFIKDANGKLLSQNEYNYRNQ